MIDYSENKLVDNIEQIFNKQGYQTKKEVRTGNGIVDLISGLINKERVKQRKSYGQNYPLLKEYYFEILDLIPDINNAADVNPISFEEITKNIPMSRNYLKYHAISYLLKGGYITEIKKDFYYKVDSWTPITDELIAIEAKLYDWKRGLSQALRYKTISEQAYLAVPAEIVNRVDSSLFKKFGVGLMSYSMQYNKLEIVVDANNSDSMRDSKFNYVSEHLFFNH